MPLAGEPVRIADLGAGTGAVGFAVASRVSSAAVTMIERDDRSCADIERSLALAENAHLRDRLHAVKADLTEVSAAHLPVPDGNGYDWVLANPPFNARSSHRTSPDARRAGAHAMDDDLLDGWLRAALRLLGPRGRVAMILRPESLPSLLGSWSDRLGGPNVLPVYTGDGGARRILVGGVRGSRAPTALLPPLHVRHAGGVTKAAAAIADGERGLQLVP